MPFKSWGSITTFEKYYKSNLTEHIPTGKIVGLYGYQPIPATLSQNAFTALQTFDLGFIVSTVQTAMKCEVNYAQLSWNEPGGTQVTDLVLAVVLTSLQDIDGAQQILNTIFTTSLGAVLAEAYMNQLNAWVVYRLNESPPIDLVLIAGVGVAAVIGIVLVASILT